MYGNYNQPKHVRNQKQTKPFNDSHISLALKLNPFWFCFSSLSPIETRYTTAQAWYPLLPFSFLLLLLLLATTTAPSFLPISTKLQCTSQTASDFSPACHPFHRMLDQSIGFFLSFSSFTVSLHFSGLIFLLPRIMISAEVLWPLLLLWKQYFSTLMEHCVIQILSIFMLFATCFKKSVVFLLLIYNILVHVLCKKKRKNSSRLTWNGAIGVWFPDRR